MISRGYLIGEIIDGLSSVSQQVENRCILGLTDLNKYLEDFFKTIINTALNINLVNLNQQRSNEPGLDLGDEVNQIAFQITSQKTSIKVTETLSKVTPKQLQVYEKIVIFVIGKKQSSYTVDQVILTTTHFDLDEDIWDINTLCRLMIDLPLDKLKTIYDYMSAEITRVKIELEIPNAEGQYETSIQDYVEPVPTFTIGDLSNYRLFLLKYMDLNEADLPLVNVKSDIDTFVLKLKELPRITRQVYAFLVCRSEATENYDYFLRFNFDKLKRICRYPDLDGELRLLEEANLISYNDSPCAEGKSMIVRIYHHNRATDNQFIIKEIAAYCQERTLPIEKAVVNLDFSNF